MINCSLEQRKYIVEIDLPDDITDLEYRVYVNDRNKLLFLGKPKHFTNKFDVDCTDWIEQYVRDQYKNEIVVPGCVVYVDFKYTDVDGGRITTTKQLEYTPEYIGISKYKDIKYSVRGLVPVSFKGIASVFNNSTDFPKGMVIYPIPYYKCDLTVTQRPGIPGRIFKDVQFCFDPFTSLDVLPYGYGYYKYNLMSDKVSMTQNQFETLYYPFFNNNVMKKLDLDRLKKDSTLSGLYNPPKLYWKDPLGTIPYSNYYQKLAEYDYNKVIEPIKYIGFDTLSETIDINNFSLVIDMYEIYRKYNSGYFNDIRYLIQSHPDYTYKGVTYSGFSGAELCGVGFKCMFIYSGCSYSPFQNSVGLYSEEWTTPRYFESLYSAEDINSNGTAYLLLINSGFTMPYSQTKNLQTVDRNGSTTTETNEVVVPLIVKNKAIKGKTTNVLDKTTYMDKYGDTHNSKTDNRFEIECYVDPSFLSYKNGSDGVETNYDYNYEKVMLALQNAQQTFLCFDGTNVRISGFPNLNQIGYVEGRVKDVEKIETNSNYTSNRQLSYKIVFEVYN